MIAVGGILGSTPRLYRKLNAAGKLKEGPLDMEPLEVLVEMIQADQYDTIAGPPQIVKVYPYARILPINVLWPIAKPTYVAHFGRPLLGYEGSRYACLDLATNELLAPYEAYERIGPQTKVKPKKAAAKARKP